MNIGIDSIIPTMSWVKFYQSLCILLQNIGNEGGLEIVATHLPCEIEDSVVLACDAFTKGSKDDFVDDN